MRRPAIFLGIIFAQIFLGIMLLGISAWCQTSGLTSGRKPSQRTSLPALYLITIDTLRAAHVGCYGYKQGEHPALNALASDAVRFRPPFSHSPLTRTSHW